MFVKAFYKQRGVIKFMKELNLADYRLTPSVVKSGVATEITILPLGENSAFLNEYEYTLEVWPVETAIETLEGATFNTLTLKPVDGKLIFTYTFEEEQQYLLKIILPEDLQYYPNPYYRQPYRGRYLKCSALRNPVLSLYCLEEDLYGMSVFKGDMHLHSYSSDGHDAKGTVIANLKKAGYDYAALTDHYWYNSSVEVDKLFSDLPDVFTCLPGEEVHMENEYIHEVVIGGKQSVNTYYYENFEECEAQIRKLEEILEIPEGIDRHNYACRYWVADTAKKFGGTPIMTHPYWHWRGAYFVPPKITKFMFEQGNYEIFELLNSSCGRETNMLQVAFYYDELSKGFDMPIVGSSDSHCTERENEQLPTDHYTLVFAKDRSWESIREAILAKRNVAVEHYEVDKNFRVYGNYRMVKYANFLLLNYYPDYMNLCHEQGVLMKEYARTKDKEIIELMKILKKRTDNFNAMFFGRE